MDYEGKITYIMSIMKMHPDTPELVATAVLAAEIAELRKAVTGAIKANEVETAINVEELREVLRLETNPIMSQIAAQIIKLANLIEKAPIMRMAVARSGDLTDVAGNKL